jgi:hypothetical protein
MHLPRFESVLVRLAAQEYQMLVRLMEVRQQSSSDVLRDLLGLPPEHEVRRTRDRSQPRLQLVPALAPAESSEFASEPAGG